MLFQPEKTEENICSMNVSSLQMFFILSVYTLA